MPRTGSFVAPTSLFLAVGAAVATPVPAGVSTRAPTSWSMFGGTPSRNMVNPYDALPPLPPSGPLPEGDAATRLWEARWLRWKADLGSRAYGGPTVAGGRVYVGTNNQRPRNARDVGRNADGEIEPIDRGILMCFDEATGRILWQAVHDKLLTGQVNDWPHQGVCSVPTVVGDRVYYVSNQCRVVCLDPSGFANGNQGVQTEKYRDPTDADVLWEYDMIRELGVFPHNMANGYPLVVGDLLYVVTGNGVDEGHLNIPAPDAPSLVCLNRHTGRLVWSDKSPGKAIMHGQWSHPSYTADPVPQVIFAGGDGWLRAFDPPTGRLLWQFDCNPKDGVYELGGTGTKTDFIGCPVVSDGKVYIGVGQDPEHTDGIGRFWCIDLKKAVVGGAGDPKRDVSPELVVRSEKRPDGTVKVETRRNPASAVVWMFGGEETRPFSVRDFKFGRTMCTACIADDILYIGDLPGFIHAINAKTGQHYWQYDTKTSMWGSCYYVDGKVLFGNDNGDLYVWRHDKAPPVIEELDPNAPNLKAARAFRLAQRKVVEHRFLLAKIELDAPIRTTPVVAGGVLYVVTEKTLFAFGRR